MACIDVVLQLCRAVVEAGFMLGTAMWHGTAVRCHSEPPYGARFGVRETGDAWMRLSCTAHETFKNMSANNKTQIVCMLLAYSSRS